MKKILMILVIVVVLAGVAIFFAMRNHYILLDDSVTVLKKSFYDDGADDGVGRNAAKFADYRLAAQLLAAQLNYEAGAEQCTTITTAIADANLYLEQVEFDGVSNGIRSKDDYFNEINTLATTLDDYNNYGCP